MVSIIVNAPAKNQVRELEKTILTIFKKQLLMHLTLQRLKPKQKEKKFKVWSLIKSFNPDGQIGDAFVMTNRMH